MRRGGLSIRGCLVLVMLVGLLVSVPQTVRAADGDLWVWGGTAQGKLGFLPGTYLVTTPHQEPALPGKVVQIAAGAAHSVTLLEDGTIWSWGRNSAGTLGIGNHTSSSVDPVQAIGLPPIKAISSSTEFVLALTEDGEVYAWGHNVYGELGNNTRTWSNVPIKVEGLTNIVDIATGEAHSLALAADGTVYGWGANVTGQLGLGFTDPNVMLTPTIITALNNLPGGKIVNVAAGTRGPISLAMTEDGTLYAFGYLPAESNRPFQSTPIVVAGISNVIDAAAGVDHIVALTDDGDVYSWGDEAFTGTGETGEFVTEPTLVMSGVKAIAAGPEHSLALTEDGTIYSWGNNGAGQLGIGTDVAQRTPVQVQSSVNFSAIAVGWDHSLAIQEVPAPTTTATVNGAAAHNGWYQSAAVALTSDDLTATTTYEIGPGATQTYTGPFTLSPDGVYTITFRSAGTLNNTEDDQTITVRVDSTAPVIQPIANQTLSPANTAGAPVTFTVQVTDNLSSAGTISANCVDQDNQPFVSGDTAPVGLTTITCTATDLAGNSSSVSFTVTVEGVEALFDDLAVQIRALELPRVMEMSLLAQVSLAERLANADRPLFSCLQLRVLDLTIRLFELVRLVPATQASNVRDQIGVVRGFLEC